MPPAESPRRESAGAGMKTLTLQRLIDLGACADQRELFRETFGDSVDVTPELCVSVADKFDWRWAAEHLLSAPAWAEYERATAPAWAECERVEAPAWAEYERVKALARAEYKRVEAPAWAEYQRVEARTFGELYEGGAQS